MPRKEPPIEPKYRKRPKDVSLPIEPKFLPEHVAAKYVSMCKVDFLEFAAKHGIGFTKFDDKRFRYFWVSDIDEVFNKYKIQLNN